MRIQRQPTYRYRANRSADQRDGKHNIEKMARVALLRPPGTKYTSAVRAAVLAHAGLTIASEWMFTPELRSGAVRAVLSEWSLPPLDLWAVFPTGRAATAKARAFIDFFERSFNPRQELMRRRRLWRR